MSRYCKSNEPSTEMLIKMIRAKDETSNMEKRTVRCPYCQHSALIVYADARGHVQTKCKNCGHEVLFDVVSMRRIKR